MTCPTPVRAQVLARLEQLGADESVLRPVREYHELEAAQESIALGDALPIGLRLRRKNRGQPQRIRRAASVPGCSRRGMELCRFHGEASSRIPEAPKGAKVHSLAA